MNSSYAGYTPEKSTLNSELDTINPFEFKRGMDYELISLGCARLRESTLEERMKSTKRVVKNLQEHPSYYTSLIHYETEFRNQVKKPTFKKWLKEYEDESKMKPVSEKDILKEKADKREVAATIMDRQTHKDLLGIIQECGVSMNEGTDNIRPYYEVAKMAYMEGLTAGLRN